jgi:hypothetical protein
MSSYQHEKQYVVNYFADMESANAEQVVSVLEKHVADDCGL